MNRHGRGIRRFVDALLMAAQCCSYLEDRHPDHLMQALNDSDLPCLHWHPNAHAADAGQGGDEIGQNVIQILEAGADMSQCVARKIHTPDDHKSIKKIAKTMKCRR